MSDNCFWCDEPILPGDDTRTMPHLPESGPAQVMQYHRNCIVRMIFGGVNHLKGNCSCCGGTEEPDPPGMTRREAADAAAAAWKALST